MKTTDDRKLFDTPIGASAASGNIATIPQTQVKAGDGTASIALGFPPETFIARAAGGEPPRGQDMNGFLNRLSAAVQILQAGYLGPFDETFAQGIGGYPAGAIVSGSTPGTFWVSTADSNASTPGADGAKWQSLFNGLVTGTAGKENQAVTNLQMVNATSGDSNSAYMQVVTPSGAIAVPTMTYTETKLGLMTPQGWSSHQIQTPSAGTAFWIESDVTFRTSGQLFMFVSANMGQSGVQQPSQCYLRIYLDDNILTSEYTTNAMSLSWVSSVNAGAHTIKSLYLPNTGNYNYISTGVTLSWLFVPNPT